MTVPKFLFPLLFFTSAHATDFIVTTIVDEPDDGGGLTYEQADGDGLSLREAIGLANRNGTTFLILPDGGEEIGTGGGEIDGDTITFDPALGSPLLISSSFTISDDISIDGFLTETTNATINAQEMDRLFTIETSGAPGSGQVSLKNLRLENGSSFSGGGISCDSADPIEIDSVILLNSKAIRGGGIANIGGDLTLRSCFIVGNSATSDSRFGEKNGGGIYHGGHGIVTLSDTTIGFNTAGERGGGVALDVGSQLNLEGGCEFTHNISNGLTTDQDGGGAICNNGGIINLSGAEDVNINRNSTTGHGAGILMFGGTITNLDPDHPDGFRPVFLSNNTAGGNGGGIAFFDESHPGETFIGATFTMNSAGDQGGGIYIDGFFPEASLVRFIFFGNTAATSGGGAATNYIDLSGCLFLNNSAPQGGGLYNTGDLTFSGGSTFHQNQATGETGKGGGLYLNGGVSKITHGYFDTNASSAEGGGIYLENGTLTLEECVLKGNTAGAIPLEFSYNGSGGGIAISGISNLTLEGTSIVSNTASFIGGGCSFDISSTCIAHRSTIAKNQSYGNGGGISAEYGIESFTLEDTTVAQNQARFDGGGVAIRGSSHVTLTNATITGNTASGEVGGIIADFGLAEVTNSVIAGNSAPDSVFDFLTTTSSFLSGDPLLFPDETPITIPFPSGVDFEIPTLSYQPHPHSPLIDAGVARPAEALDQRGNPRTVGDAPDIGAIEQQTLPQSFVAWQETAEPISDGTPKELQWLFAAPLARSGSTYNYQLNPGAPTAAALFEWSTDLETWHTSLPENATRTLTAPSLNAPATVSITLPGGERKFTRLGAITQ